MGVLHLPFRILYEIGLVSLGHAHPGIPACYAGGMLMGVEAQTARFHADEFHLFIVEEAAKDAAGVGAAANTGIDPVRQAAGLLQHLLPRLLANNGLKPGDH